MGKQATIDKRETVNGARRASRPRAISLKVNGETHDVTVRPRHTLVDVIRSMLGLTGTKEGCQSGSCGVCTVLLNGRPVLGCLTLAVSCDGAEVTTVEGLADGTELNPLQQAFLDQGAAQCGFCTPGMLMSATALLKANPKPSVDEIKKALEGNLCRCTGYNAIMDAVLQASDQGVKPLFK
jgi:carbon-monoxide dehydrogenase small subunit